LRDDETVAGVRVSVTTALAFAPNQRAHEALAYRPLADWHIARYRAIALDYGFSAIHHANRGLRRIPKRSCVDSNRSAAPDGDCGGEQVILAGDLLLGAALLYVLAGSLYALRFCGRTAGRVNDRARLAGPLFRLMLAPAAILLWPMLLGMERNGRLQGEAADEPEVAG
jgi:hypothetical protein